MAARWFGWKPPLFDNRLRAFHCIDICFWFHNTDVMLTHTGGGARPRKLATRMAGSLLQFMRTGDPNGGGLPNTLVGRYPRSDLYVSSGSALPALEVWGFRSARVRGVYFESNSRTPDLPHRGGA